MSHRNIKLVSSQSRIELVENATANGLTVFLGVPDFYESFRDFLAAEFALESLRFCEKVDELREIVTDHHDESSPSLRCSVASISFSRIFDEFLAPGAVSELNLISDLRVELAMLMQEVNDGVIEDSERHARGFLERLAKTLAKAHSHIFQLMTNDMFNRYVLSKHYNALLSKVKAEAEGKR